MRASKDVVSQPAASFGGTNESFTLLFPSYVDARPDGLAFLFSRNSGFTGRK